MIKLTLGDLVARGDGVPGFIGSGRLIDEGGFRRYDEPGFRTHNEHGVHVHPSTHEIFCIFQGCGVVEIDSARVAEFRAGDVVVIEPGEDHHLISTGDVPLVFTWMHLEPPAKDSHSSLD